jgi:hypothetical protein
LVKIKIKGTTSRNFGLDQGIKQGSPLSGILYVAYMKKLLTRLKSSGTGPELGGVRIPALMYMDDVILVARDEEEMKIQAKIIKELAAEHGFLVNNTKTQIIAKNTTPEIHNAARNLWGVEGVRKSLKYLGIILQANGTGGTEHWKDRLRKMIDAAHVMRQAGMRWGRLDRNNSMELYEKILVPIMMYGTEVTQPANASLKKADASQAKAVRPIMGLEWNANTKWTLWETGTRRVQTRLEGRKLNLARKIIKSPPGGLLHKIRKGLIEEGSDLYICIEAEEIAAAWNVRHWLLPGIVSNRKDETWKAERDYAVEERETELFDSWANGEAGPTKYYHYKTWYGASDLGLELEDDKIEKAIILARANQIGVAADHTRQRDQKSNKCNQCGGMDEDTLGHALWECTDMVTSYRRERAITKLKAIWENHDSFNNDWKHFKEKTSEEKLKLVLSAPAEQEEEIEELTLATWKIMGPLLQHIRSTRGGSDL